MMNSNFHLILASKSPRRKEILSSAGFQFSVRVSGYEEIFSDHIPPHEMAVHLSDKKAEHLRETLKDEEIILAADTVVICQGEILGKPSDESDARDMLLKLSGKQHEVVTGCTLLSLTNKVSFDDLTRVTFKKLSDEEINHYIQVYKPFDKAGGYGIQEWLGMIGITEISGSYFTVMGLPIHKVYEALKTFAV